MNSLNDDCIIEVLKRMQLQDQINMALASEDYKNILRVMWQGSYETLDLNSMENITNLNFFIKCIEGDVRKLILNEKHQNLNEILNEVKFTNVAIVHIIFPNTKASTYEDLVLSIGNFCPNLVELHLGGDITGKNICKFKKLERISLFCVPGELDYNNTEQLFKSLKLKRVCLKKSVHWESWEYMTIASDELFQQILQCDTLEELCFDSDFMQERFLDSMVVHLKQLRKLSFSGLLWLDYGQLRGSVCKSVQGLIIKGRAFDDKREAEGLLSLLTRLSNLEVLSLSKIRIDLSFLRQIIQTRVDCKPLVIHCHDTQVTERDLSLLTNSLPDWITVRLDAYEHKVFDIYFDIQILLKREAV